MSTSKYEHVEIEQLLAEAGFDFTVVERCPDPVCVICTGNGMPAAA